MQADDLKQIFKTLDAYLLGDLETMIIEVGPRPSGGLGYPAIQTISSGMELMGIMLSGGHKSKGAFEYFWNEYFVKDNPGYDNNVLGDIFRDAVRDGTSHYFLVKFGIQVSKEANNNLTRTKEGNLNIDLIVLYKDFQTTFYNIRDLILKGKDKEASDKFYNGYKSLAADLNKSKETIREYIKGLPEYKESSPQSSKKLSPVEPYFVPTQSVSHSPSNFVTTTTQIMSSHNSNASATTLPIPLINTIPSEPAE